MNKLKTLVVLGHPKTETFSGHLAKVYMSSATKAKKEVRFIKLGEI